LPVGRRFEEERARNITAPLHAVHYLRSKVKGHASRDDAARIKRDTLAAHKELYKLVGADNLRRETLEAALLPDGVPKRRTNQSIRETQGVMGSVEDVC
jgi:hypothetical protein